MIGAYLKKIVTRGFEGMVIFYGCFVLILTQIPDSLAYHRQIIYKEAQNNLTQIGTDAKRFSSYNAQKERDTNNGLFTRTAMRVYAKEPAKNTAKQVRKKRPQVYHSCSDENCNTFIGNLAKIASSSYFTRQTNPVYIQVIEEKMSQNRAFTSDQVIHINTKIKTEQEKVAVFVHELAHMIDIWYLTQKNENADVSKDFYAISWQDETQKNVTTTPNDFISGYAATDYYEDFAESVTFYILYNADFIKRAQNNTILQKKYDFIATHVFPHGDFIGTSFSSREPDPFIWDTTTQQIDLQKFLSFIQ